MNARPGPRPQGDPVEQARKSGHLARAKATAIRRGEVHRPEFAALFAGEAPSVGAGSSSQVVSPPLDEADGTRMRDRLEWLEDKIAEAMADFPGTSAQTHVRTLKTLDDMAWRYRRALGLDKPDPIADAEPFDEFD